MIDKHKVVFSRNGVNYIQNIHRHPKAGPVTHISVEEYIRTKKG